MHNVLQGLLLNFSESHKHFKDIFANLKTHNVSFTRPAP